MFANKTEEIYLSRSDPNQPLSSFSRHGFELEDRHWPSVEHYFQDMKFEDHEAQEKVRLAKHPEKARRLGRSRLRKLRSNWSQLRRVMMTRAVYTKCRTHPDVAEALLSTGDTPIFENSQYDYYWGCGRDRRGHNVYGQVLMDVRNKLREEANENADIS